MNLNLVAINLANLNNGDMYNTGGDCEPISVLAADALVTGITPALGSGLSAPFSPVFTADAKGIMELLSLPPDQPNDSNTRAFTVWRWLKHQAPAGVYVFAQDKDHCYDFVIDGDVFLIDASQQIYRKINTPGDASFYHDANSPYAPGFQTGKVGNYPPSNTNYGFNYLSPQPLKHDDNLRIFRWGNLHQRWR